AFVLARTGAEALRGLTALAHGEPADNPLLAHSAARGATAPVFPGSGSPRPAMPLQLLATAPVFAAELDACAAALARWTGWTLSDVLHGRPSAPDLTRVHRVKAVL
ncbi:hypothetical protein VM98_38040, partial [Streptomyces rubellomurinus subsp. indigoferus]